MQNLQTKYIYARNQSQMEEISWESAFEYFQTLFNWDFKPIEKHQARRIVKEVISWATNILFLQDMCSRERSNRIQHSRGENH